MATRSPSRSKSAILQAGSAVPPGSDTEASAARRGRAPKVEPPPEWAPSRDKSTSKLLQVPADDAAMLKWLAGTTYGDTETKIIFRALRREMASMFRDKGYKVEEAGEEGKFKVVSGPRARTSRKD